jgi:hypothetical protein
VPPRRLQVARQPVLLAVEDEARADLEDVRVLAEQRAGIATVSLRRPDMRTISTPARRHASTARAPSSDVVPSPSWKASRAAEEGRVEVEVHAAHGGASLRARQDDETSRDPRSDP